MVNILILEEKYGNTYYDVSTPELLARACATVLRDREADGYYTREYLDSSLPTPSNAKEATMLELTDEQIKDMPTAFKNSVFESREKFAARIARFRREQLSEQQWFNALNLVIKSDLDKVHLITTETVEGFGFKTNPISVAEALLRSRTDYQYESYEIEKLHKA